MTRRAFSLIELLVVIVIISILVGLMVPAVLTMGRAQSLSSGAAAVVDQLTFARQTALARNRVVEVRFYRRRENPEMPDDPVINPVRFRALRTVIYDQKVQTWSPLSTMQSLPTNVVIMEEQAFSTLMFPYEDLVPSRVWQEETISGYNEKLKYQFIRFKPSGSTDLPPDGTTDADKWFLTVKLANDPIVEKKPAYNYVTAMVEPVSGRVRTFRP
ncbi:MAG: hypothetical protein QOE70_3058 [Chthoniobacter sp.]|jgi:uncharacterized protein (TIGR02596 family)|nr:hypothetical protein [Chthoniobacter sp.]